MRLRALGKPRWPWKAFTVTPANRPPIVTLNRYPGQVIGIAFRLPAELYFGRPVFKQLSILWARPDIRQYPKSWTEGTVIQAPHAVLSHVIDPIDRLHEIRNEVDHA